MTLRQLDLLIVSDLHAHRGDPRVGDAPSYCSTSDVYNALNINPLTSIPEVIAKAGLKVDWLICPGDLGDKADSTSQKIAWESLEKIRQAVGAKHLIGTTGNHDVDSRRILPQFDPKSTLQLLTPTFPVSADCYETADNVFSDRFWSKNFVLVPFKDYDCSLLILNSCAFHGFASDANKKLPAEHLRGKLSPLTLAAIKSVINTLTTRLNIVLVHHHVVKIPYVDDGDSVMDGGDILLDHLMSTNKQWLVIHGHAHVPSLRYASANQFAPVVLSAGSVAAKTARVKGGFARNQIHHMSIDLAKIEDHGTQIYGRLTSWSWAFENGWVGSSGAGVLPYHSGFGYRFDAVETRDDIIARARAASPRLLQWTDLLLARPKLSYLVPDDQASLVKLLETGGVRVEPDTYGGPVKLEWPA